MPPTVKLRSLTNRTLVRMAARIAVVVAIATVIGYMHVSHSLQTQALEQLQQYIRQRGVRENLMFELARDNLRVFAQDYAKRLSQPPTRDSRAAFADLFVTREDGGARLKPALFDSAAITGLVSPQIELDPELQRRLALGVEMLAQYGPAWRNRFTNLYITTPENAVLMYWPGKPWGLNASAWEVYAKLAWSAPGSDAVLVIDEDSRRAPRQLTWSDLYFDYAVNDWVVSAIEPVNLAGRYIISVGQDILLRKLIDRTLNDHLAGAYNLIFREDGRLLVHPRYMDAIRAQSGYLSIADTGDANLMRIFTLVKAQPPDVAIIENRQDREYLAVAGLQAPGWRLVTVFPQAIIAQQAFKTARLVLLLGVVALLLEIAISYLVLNKHIAQPLTSLMQAANRVAAGDFSVQLDERRPDEIGRLARSFNTMSKEINARETVLNERNAKLTLLNAQLQQQLEERNRAEQEIARQREALHQSEKLNALGSLLAGVAHELNNPLSVIVGRAIMLEAEIPDPSLRTKLGKVRLAAERCARIVKTFLAIARQQPPRRASVQVNEVIAAALELVSYGLRTADIELTVEQDPAAPPIEADPDQLTQVFTNLLINAQEALLEAPPPRRLRVSTGLERTPPAIRIAVADNGPGVPVDLRARIFEPFFTSKPTGMGTGIGLSYSQGVVVSHGGSLTLESSAEGGACFVVRLPVTSPPAATTDSPPDAAPASNARAILIVDDEPEIADLLQEILAPEGHRIDSVATGNQALRQLARRQYDLILCDLKMPDLDGPGLHQRLQQSYPQLLSRLIFITGDTLSGWTHQFLAQTGCPVLEKPFVPADVIQIIHDALAHARKSGGG